MDTKKCLIKTDTLKLQIQILPFGVHCFNQVEFPFPVIALDAFFTLDRIGNIEKPFKPDQHSATVFFVNPGNRPSRCSNTRLERSVVTPV